MHQTQEQNPPDSLEAALNFLEEENRNFENHWVWKKLGCKPQEFFQAVNKHVASLNIPKDKWDAAFKRAQEANRVQVKEKRNTFNPLHFQLMAGIQV